MIAEIGARFEIDGDYIASERYYGGHINQTYFATYATALGERRYVHQRINTAVFSNPYALTENISAVTRHVHAKLVARGVTQLDRRVLRLVPTREGSEMLVAGEGEYWRTYPYVDASVCYGRVRNAPDAFAAARAFGEFAALLADFPAATLHDTLPRFHDTPARFEALVSAIERDACNRAEVARDEISAALALESLAGALEDVAAGAELPRRVTHNDAKITNVLFDEASGEAICVLDLDTLMPGLALYDVGELVRTAGTRVAEDERDASKVRIDPALFAAIANGYLAGAGDIVSKPERAAFVTAGKVMAFENGIRFLADFLNGDVYYQIRHAYHNLDRARNQFAVVRSLSEQEETLLRLVGSAEPVA
jgi:hypothetical protein